MEREIVQEMIGLWAIGLSSRGVQLPVSDCQELVSKIMQLVTTVKKETLKSARAAVANTPDPNTGSRKGWDTFSTGINNAMFSIGLMIENPEQDPVKLSTVWRDLLGATEPPPAHVDAGNEKGE